MGKEVNILTISPFYFEVIYNLSTRILKTWGIW